MAITTLGSKAVGDIVKLKENGVAVNYIVVHQGLPSSIYDSSCNGTWLLRKDFAETMVWNSTADNNYEESEIHSWLNSTMLPKYDDNIQSEIKQVKIPYRKNGGIDGTDCSGANGLSTKIFLLSCYEVGWTTESSGFPVDGAKLDYFEDGNNPSANSKRVEGLAARWWLRSPSKNNASVVWQVDYSGNYEGLASVYSDGIRPALVLSSELLVSDDGNVTKNTAPTTPGSISVPQTITEGDTITVSWGASTDAEGNLSGYKLEKSTNGGGSWSQIYQGSARSKTDTIASGTTQVMYRVKAYDAMGLESGYRTSSNVTVNRRPTITCDSPSGTNLGEKSADFSVGYTVGDADNDTVTVTELMDNAQKRSYTATLNQQTQFDVTGEYFMTLLNGSHNMKITASDGKASVEHTLTFTKKVNAASISLAAPMEADAAITACALSIEGEIPDDANLTIKVTNNANDTSPVWEDCTTAVKQNRNHVFTNATASNGFAFNFRIEVSRGTSGTGGYITSVQGGFQ